MLMVTSGPAQVMNVPLPMPSLAPASASSARGDGPRGGPAGRHQQHRNSNNNNNNNNDGRNLERGGSFRRHLIRRASSRGKKSAAAGGEGEGGSGAGANTSSAGISNKVDVVPPPPPPPATRMARPGMPRRAQSVPSLKAPPRDTARKSSGGGSRLRRFESVGSSGGGGKSGGAGTPTTTKAMFQKISREQRGLCGECGARTHEFRTDAATGIRAKVPLTVEGKVRRGRCLFCHPLPAAGGGNSPRVSPVNSTEDGDAHGGGGGGRNAPPPSSVPAQPQQQPPQLPAPAAHPPPLTSVNIDERVERWRKHRIQQQQSQQAQQRGSGQQTQPPQPQQQDRDRDRDQDGGGGGGGGGGASGQQQHFPPPRSMSAPRPGRNGSGTISSSFRSSSFSTINTVSTLGFEADPADVKSVTSSSGVTIKRIRERRGLCAECGARTHEFANDGAKVPLTVEGEVRRGRCLHCHPLPGGAGASAAPAQQQAQQQQHDPAGRGAHLSRGRSASESEGDARTDRSLRAEWPCCGGRGGGGAAGIPDRSGFVRSVSAGRLQAAERGAESSAAAEGRRRRRRCSSPDDDMDVIAATAVAAAALHTAAASAPHNGGGGVRRGSFCSTMSVVSSCDLESMESEHTSESVRARRAADAELAAAERLHRLGTGTGGGGNGNGGGADDLCDIIATMRQYPANPTIQDHGCRKLWSQSKNQSNGAAIGRAGGIPTVINAMRTHGPCRSLQFMGCEALQNLARHSEYNRRVIREGGGVSAVLHGMENHRRVVGVQVCGCAALAVIGDLRGANGGGNGGGGGNKNGGAWGRGEEAAVLCALRGAIEAFPQEERVLRSAYKTLKALGYKPMEVLARWQEEKEGG